MTGPRYERFLTADETATLIETLGLRDLVRSIVREEYAEMAFGKLETLADHAAAPADSPSAGAATPRLLDGVVDEQGLIAAFKALGQWFDEDGNRELLGATPAMAAQVAVSAYARALRTANDQLEAVADQQAGAL